MTLNPSTRVVKRASARSLLFLVAVLLSATAGLSPAIAADLLAEGASAYDAGKYGEAASIWRPLAEEGDPKAQFNLGLLHETGRGVTDDPAEAAAWYERAARQGVTQAQLNLAALHQTGRGVAQDPAEALYWLRVGPGLRGGGAPRGASGGAPDGLGVAAGLGGAAAREQASVTVAELAPLLEDDEAEAAQARARAFAPRLEEPPIQRVAVTLILSPSQIEVLQRRLAAHGYDPGPADGIPGEMTRNAARRYLADRGLEWPESEHLTQRLLDLVVEP